MRALFQPRGLLLFWIILTAAAGLSQPMKSFAGEIVKSKSAIVTPINSGFSSVNDFAQSTARSFFTSVKFDAAGQVANISAAGVIVRTRDVMAFIGLVLLFVAIWLYQRAVKTDSFTDDILALILLYIWALIVLSIVLGLGFAIQPALQRNYVLAFFILLVVFLALRAGAMEDSRLFFRAFFEILILTIFLFPDGTIDQVANSINGIASFGDGLQKNAAFFPVWSAVGFTLALFELYNIGRKKSAAPAGGKGKGGPPGGK